MVLNVRGTFSCYHGYGKLHGSYFWCRHCEHFQLTPPAVVTQVIFFISG